MTLACLDCLASQSCTELGPAQPQLVPVTVDLDTVWSEDDLKLSQFNWTNWLLITFWSLGVYPFTIALEGYCNCVRTNIKAKWVNMHWKVANAILDAALKFGDQINMCLSFH